LLATDINPRILRRAMRGVYGEWSFRNSPPGFKDNYFSCLGKGKYELQAEIRNMVTFAYHNLAADAFPTPMNDTNAMDLIFCRNVLMYFSPARARLVGQRLYNCLVEGGWLIVSASELSQHTFAQFDATNFPGAIVYRRPSGKLRPAEALRIEKPKPAKKKPLPPPATGAVQPVAAFPGSPQPEWAHPAEFVETAPLATPPPDVLQVVRALANQGRLFEAWAACESALKADKLDPSLHYLAATILQELKRDDEAMTMLKRALYLNPNFLPAYFTLGNLAQRCGNTAIASKAFKNVLALLEGYQADDILPEAEGLTVGRLREIVRLTLQTRAKQ
jgi:chemotaxis protein methyltransferase CheR